MGNGWDSIVFKVIFHMEISGQLVGVNKTYVMETLAR